MAEPGDVSLERLAELEKQLADAAARVAHVQAQLEQARGGSPAPPPGGRPADLTAALGPYLAQVLPATPTTVERLAEPPRRVPFAFRLSSF